MTPANANRYHGSFMLKVKPEIAHDLPDPNSGEPSTNPEPYVNCTCKERKPLKEPQDPKFQTKNPTLSYEGGLTSPPPPPKKKKKHP